MRTITVVLEIKDEKAAKVIWDAHSKGLLLNGCLVSGIADGDMIERAYSLTEDIFEMPSPKRRGTIRAKLVYKGRGKPIPTEEP